MERKLNLFGHMCRMDDQRLMKNVMFGMVNGTSLEEGLAENGWMMSKIGVTWIYTLSAGWLRIDYYGDMF